MFLNMKMGSGLRKLKSHRQIKILAKYFHMIFLPERISLWLAQPVLEIVDWPMFLKKERMPQIGILSLP